MNLKKRFVIIMLVICICLSFSYVKANNIQENTLESETNDVLEAVNSEINSLSLETRASSNVNIENGTYYISSAINEDMVWNVTNSSEQDGTRIEINQNQNYRSQKFYIEKQSNGYYKIRAICSDKFVDVYAGEKTNGAIVDQYTENQSDAQYWSFQETEDGYYTIKSKCNGLVVDIYAGIANAGTKLQMYENNGSMAQKFKLEKVEKMSSEKTLEDGRYYIKSLVNSQMVLGIAGNSNNNFGNVELQIKDTKNAYQLYDIKYESDGYYSIKNVGSNKALDVYAGLNVNGTNVDQYTANGSDAQKWILRVDGNGNYEIISKCNELNLDIPAGLANEHANIQVYQGNNSNAQKFILQKVETIEGSRTIEDGIYSIYSVANPSMVLDVENASTGNSANVRMWNKNQTTSKRFKITYIEAEKCYQIEAIHSGKLLDVYAGSGVSGTNVQQYEDNNSDAQKWIIKEESNGYSIICKGNGLYLDIYAGVATNGANVQVYDGNNTNAQRFNFQKETQTLENGIYAIKSAQNNNMAVEVGGASTSNFANVQTWEYVGEPQQRFKIEFIGDNTYTMQALHSKKMLDVYAGQTTDGANVDQYEANGSDAQKWILEYVGNGNYKIKSKCNGLYLTVQGNSIYNGANIATYMNNNTALQMFKFEEVQLSSEGTYGNSGSNGYNLEYYKWGYGPNVLFTTFSVHGFEDIWNQDGTELTLIAQDFYNYLKTSNDESLAEKWTVYIFPEVNPDGRRNGWTNDGPGRTTLTSQSPTRQGIDLNRCWQIGSSYTRYTDSRNYNGTAGFQAVEASSLRNFLLDHKSANGQTILVDLHGWLNETIGDNGLGSYYRSQFGMSTHISSYGTGYLVNWARNSLGGNGKVARSVLVELPTASSHQDVVNKKYSQKYINATINMMRGIN